MAVIFGADSKARADVKLINGYDLYSWVMRMNGFPAFWGRSISGENHIEMEELEFLRDKNCRVALIFNELTEAGVSAMSAEEDAMRAIKAARTIGAPDYGNIAIFAAIGDKWSINNSWMMSYAHMLSSNGYIPGFIGNTDSSKNFNFGRQCSHYVENTTEQNNYGTVYWATEPKLDTIEPTEWAPYCPSAMRPDQIDMWRIGINSCGNVTANKTFARDKSILKYMW